jgi:ankyrin repeat protein
MRMKRLICRLGFVFFSWFACSGADDLRLVPAVKGSDAGAVRSLIAQHADVNAAEADGSTSLHWAVQRDNLEIANLLIGAGANVTAATRYNITPLWLACTNGNAALIERLLQAGADPNSASEQGQPALMTAALTGKAEAVKVLLVHGADVNAREPGKGQTALMWAASEGNTAAAALLIQSGADVKAKSKSGFTPFLFAVRNARVDTVKMLLDHGANVDDVAPDGTSALNLAVVNAYFELAAMLLDHGADPNAPDPRGSALHSVAWLRKPGSDGANGQGGKSYAPPPPTGNITALELAQALLAHGADPNARLKWDERRFDKEGGAMRNPPLIQIGRHFLTYLGATPFYLAAHNGDAPLMRLLLDHGADPKVPNVLGITPLMVASGLDYWEGETPGPFTGCSEEERLEAVKLAIESGNDVNAAADFGNFPMTGDPNYMLLYYPFNLDDLTAKIPGDPRWNGSTALHGAAVSGQAKIVQFLIDHGAKVDAKTKSGWTPLMLAQGVFFANGKREFPAAAAILKKALAERGLLASGK